MTVETLFSKFEADYSGYGDISYIPHEADAYIWTYLAPFRADAQVFEQELDSYIQQLKLILTQIPAQKTIYALKMYPLYFSYTENSNDLITKSIEQYNNSLLELSSAHLNLKTIDFTRFCKKYSQKDLVDWRFYYISQMPVNPKLINDFNVWINREIAAIEGRRKKCLVLDLDNTLWGGILGEDGIENIKIGNTYPGSAFLDFQQNLLELSKRGVILTVCSKNNEEDVFEVWAKNPFLQIKKEQLAAWQINWDNKAGNISKLAQELNIGLDSMVFIDDNPAERELVKQMLPMVEVPDFPEQPYLLPLFFQKICEEYFQIYELTEEDRNKLFQYKANTERISVQKSFISFDDYLKSLEIELDIQKLNSMNLSRIAQMTQKTNQFNLTTKRYTDSDILSFQENGATVYCINVSDRFGDNGITGVAIIETNAQEKTACIDSFLLSCRILGKNIEGTFLREIMSDLKREGIAKITASYIPTSKNMQVACFYENNGFQLVETEEQGVKNYICNL